MIGLAVHIVVAVVIQQAYALDLGAFLDHGRRALDLQVLDQQHAVAVGQWCAVGIFDDALAALFVISGIGVGRPFMGAIGADQQFAIGVGVVQAALGAGRQSGMAQGVAFIQKNDKGSLYALVAGRGAVCGWSCSGINMHLFQYFDSFQRISYKG